MLLQSHIRDVQWCASLPRVAWTKTIATLTLGGAAAAPVGETEPRSQSTDSVSTQLWNSIICCGPRCSRAAFMARKGVHLRRLFARPV